MLETLPEILRHARQATRLSQHTLSLRINVSQRHVSFVESGRARPSRQLLLTWLAELDAPLHVRNAALVTAGYAPVYSAAPLTDPSLAAARRAIGRLLEAHDPLPAFVLDPLWNLVSTNLGGRWLAATLVPWTAELTPETPVNLLDLLVHPEGLAARIVNLPAVGPELLAHLRADAAAHPALTPRVEAFAAMLTARGVDHRSVAAGQRPLAPVLTTHYATAFGELAFFSMFTTFGTPHDITLASLRVEHLFAADDFTRAVLTAQVA
jgi:transcriptional regulator with XRE-family HTH domain